MRLTLAVAASAGLAAAGAIPHHAESKTCANELWTGEVLHLSLNIIEHPIIVDVELHHNAVVTVDKTILIECTDAPTRLYTTVTATSTATVTKTISTATISTATGLPTQTSTQSITAPDTINKGVQTEIDGQSVTSTRPATTTITASGASGASGSASIPSTETGLVAGGSAVGTGVNTDLYTIKPTYTSGRPFKANGVNLGGWLEQEKVFNQYWWDQYAPDAEDEWTFCETLGSNCGPVLEERYASFVTTADIDRLAAVGINTLRIPTTYAAWIKVPGSQLYSGNQKAHLRRIALYAIETYNMRIIVGLHSLPGGVNNLDIGEKVGNDGWFFNSTNLAYSYAAVDEILSFFVDSGYPWAFTISHLNEASDNPSAFASPNTLTANGTAWIVRYTQGVLARIAKVDSRIPLMLQDCFLSEEHWSPYFPSGTNIVIDQHVYYFAASGVYSQWANGAICGQASVLPGDGKFPVFVGEWALQTLYSNAYDRRQELFETQRYAWTKYVAGGAFWNIKHNSSAVVDGQGTQRDYWSFENLLDAGVVRMPVANATYC
ncbi:putative exo-beta-1,3-glucanase (GH5-family) member of the ScExg1-family [Aspergillus mulundensis]|uniref:glucan 1,3-beta-glucosidase n=1 Tax=Aspergillus mulundensis TaxID=1810919 RepID=A0A3D8QRV5_9EURO|nr:putative exo-beta-1,3-glucanase (GH5-family) member of the ScExg1-family [Aspergillus mulundensis]RDW64411.1 putative exo-beta-1,3-glucanase (GH5-family) member of the ScExg1-family [Aspergillus mulundensis]